MQSKKIFIWGWFGYKNVGDDLLLKTTLDSISSPDREITVAMKNRYSCNLCNAHQIKRSYLSLLFNAISHDTLVVGPGGLFPFDSSRKLQIYLHIIKFWKALNRKVVFFGVGISEKLDSSSAVLWKEIIAQADLFLTRSPETLRVIGVDETPLVHIMSDAVFATSIDFSVTKSLNSVAISVANLGVSNDTQAFKNSVYVWSHVVQFLIELGYHVDLIAFTKGADELLANTIYQSVATSNCCVRVLNYEEILQEINGWSRYKFTVCMRFHALVLSILTNTPAVPIAYGHKILSLSQKANLSKYTLTWNPYEARYFGDCTAVTYIDILDKINLLNADFEEIQMALNDISPSFIKSAKNSFLLLNDVLNQ